MPSVFAGSWGEARRQDPGPHSLKARGQFVISKPERSQLTLELTGDADSAEAIGVWKAARDITAVVGELWLRTEGKKLAVSSSESSGGPVGESPQINEAVLRPAAGRCLTERGNVECRH